MPHAASSAPRSRERHMLEAGEAPSIALQVQHAAHPCNEAPDVLYVHGATFGADLSVFFPLGDGSWADALNRAGWNVWGFDFVGFGASACYPSNLTQPAGAIEDATHDLRRAVAAILERNGGKPVTLLAHSRGAAVAARYVGENASHVRALVLFAPIAARPPSAASSSPPNLPPHYLLSVWAQYRRFIEDVPRGQPQVLAEAHMQAWARQYLAGDPQSGERKPPAVLTPSGPVADIAALWNGHALYDPALIEAPTLLIRGQWDSLCTDADAARLLSSLTARIRHDVKIPRATHLMHLEQQRHALHLSVNRFLKEIP